MNSRTFINNHWIESVNIFGWVIVKYNWIQLNLHATKIFVNFVLTPTQKPKGLVILVESDMTFSAERRNSAVFSIVLLLIQVFAVSRNASLFFSNFLNNFNFQYINFYSWILFICLIYLSLPNLYFYTIRSLTMFWKF